ncbi:amidase [Pelagicoccus sp. SDUM812003]|uniref:amidase n=1 Tax=Pelagicoccus sp. SDUM812003 TaxID=3041267 RepID=UPI0028107E50|nr:amidase [Pelagicoccus sp. SDUM812003]MDQ8204682.1 amidase [Pelagicoccus sp. SDUM812003]
MYPLSPDNHTDRRRFLQKTGLGAIALGIGFPQIVKSASSKNGGLSIESSATKLAEAVKSGSISSVELVQDYLSRISEVNPAINAVVATCPERALVEAKEADAAIASGSPVGPLHGVPFTIKDSLDTEGVVSTAGTLGHATRIPDKDATVVARLRAAGAILIGKTNTPEFTLGGGGKGTFNLVYGQTFNPHNIAHSPSGSSGGAGAIVSACGSAFDIGSDFGGSIRGPAHANGICGIKPTTGRVPRTGHWPGYGGAFDAYQQLGPLTRYVEDLATILPIISGPDFRDAAVIPAKLGDPSGVSLSTLRVAYYFDNELSPPTPETRKLVADAVKLLKPKVASVTEDYHRGDQVVYPLRNQITDADGGAWLERLLAKSSTSKPSSGLMRRINGEPISTPEFTALLEKQDAFRSKMASWFSKYDIIVCPANASPSRRLDETSSSGGGGYTRVYNVTGWPAAVVRASEGPDGMPIGLQIVGRPFKEDNVLAVAYEIEKAFGGWKAPKLTGAEFNS